MRTHSTYIVRNDETVRRVCSIIIPIILSVTASDSNSSGPQGAQAFVCSPGTIHLVPQIIRGNSITFLLQTESSQTWRAPTTSSSSSSSFSERPPILSPASKANRSSPHNPVQKSYNIVYSARRMNPVSSVLVTFLGYIKSYLLETPIQAYPVFIGNGRIIF